MLLLDHQVQSSGRAGGKQCFLPHAYFSERQSEFTPANSIPSGAFHRQVVVVVVTSTSNDTSRLCATVVINGRVVPAVLRTRSKIKIIQLTTAWHR